MFAVEWAGVRWRISLLFPALLVVLLSWEPAAPVGRCIAAAFWHESGHMLAMLLCKSRPRCVTVGAFGIRMEQDPARPLHYRRNIAVSLAGPAMNGIAAFVAVCIGETALCTVHLVLMGFNLLPLSMLDGGEALYSFLALHIGENKAVRCVRVVSYLLLFFLYTLGFLVLFWSHYNVSLLFTSIYLTAWMFFNGND